MNDLNRTEKFIRRVSALRVLYDGLEKEQKNLFDECLSNNSFKKFFKNKETNILNIEGIRNAPNHFYYWFDKNSRTKYIILKAKDLKQLNKNMNYLFNKQIKKEDNSYGDQL